MRLHLPWEEPDDDGDPPPPQPPQLEVEDTPNEVVGELLLGPTGDRLAVMYERPVVAFGFSAKPKMVTRVVREGA